MLTKLHKLTTSGHAELFLERYAQLLGWALMLTEHDRQSAGDLLHDAFIQFTLGEPDLQAIDNLDGYLRTMLRNIHISHARRASWGRLRQLSVVEYDSAEISLRSVDPRAEMLVKDQLRAVCRYACARKETSKAASVLILRFFHGYYPEEIARVSRASRPAVKERLRLARAEASLYLEDPSRLNFINSVGGDSRKEAPPLSVSPDQEDFLGELAATVLSSRQGDCLLNKQIREIYRSTNEEGIECKELAHIVSCRACLEGVNAILNLPPLTERHPTDTLGNDTRGKGGPKDGGSSGTGDRFGGAKVKSYLRRAKEVHQHEPRELFISVNGYLIGSQKVSSDLIDQTVSVQIAEPISFVEIFSEQGLRLLLLNVNPLPDGGLKQSARIRLSEARTLDLSLDSSGVWPSVHLVYHEPAPKSAKEIETPAQGCELEFGELKFGVPPSGGLCHLSQPPEGGTPNEPPEGGTPNEPPHELPEGGTTNWRGWRKSWRRITSSDLWLRPGAITAALSVFLIAALLFVQWRIPQKVTAAELLERSSAAEEKLASRADQVVHRTLNVEERRTSDMTLVSRRRIDVWRNDAQGVKARRVYDEKNRLVAGEWMRADRSRLVYRQGSKLQAAQAQSLTGTALTFDAVWRLEPMAADFAALLGNANRARVEERANAYAISFESEAGAARDGLQKAVLVLNRDDLHTVEQTLVIRERNEVREFRFVEASFERRLTSTVAPAVFEPEPELLRSGGATERRGDRAMVSPSSPLLVSPSPPPATAELEVEVLEMLNRAGTLLGEQVSMARAPEGLLQVHGIVETEKRKAEILAALEQVKTNPAVRIEIETIAEAQKKQRGQPLSSPAPISVQGVEVTKGGIPLESELRQYLVKKGIPEGRLDEEMRRFSNHVFDRSIQARLHALALKQIAERFAPAELQNLDNVSLSKWREMIRGHAQAFAREAGALRQELESILSAPPSAGGEAVIEIANDADLARAARRLFELASASDEAIRSSFSLSADRPGPAPVKSPGFWRSFHSAEELALKIQRR